MRLIFGAHQIDRKVDDADKLLLAYRADDGYPYLDYQMTSSADRIVPEDLAVTLLVNSGVTGQTFKSIQKHGPSIDLSILPPKALEATTQVERKAIAVLIAQLAAWPRFKASVATKVLHKKRPALIPILDNQAIFGAYMNRSWPQSKASGDSISAQSKIEQALNWIAIDLVREENATVWPQLQNLEPNRTLIQLFDSVWWMYFRKLQPL